ncbi:hypothetical protein ACN38_g10196 [Penicillium nordicum]|uniref:Uncharacterized protein n=1 Tax=Penicillium nordicum TaxID=229535 RepID=A0A0M8P0U4_9EURO|nr:hypothetical protein ACN38_g10196 [Penicillium nordicum]
MHTIQGKVTTGTYASFSEPRKQKNPVDLSVTKIYCMHKRDSTGVSAEHANLVHNNITRGNALKVLMFEC